MFLVRVLLARCTRQSCCVCEVDDLTLVRSLSDYKFVRTAILSKIAR